MFGGQQQSFPSFNGQMSGAINVQPQEPVKVKKTRAPRKAATTMVDGQTSSASTAASQRITKKEWDNLNLRFKAEQQKRYLLLKKNSRAENEIIRVRQEYLSFLHNHIDLLQNKSILDVAFIEQGIKTLEKHHTLFIEALGEESKKRLSLTLPDNKLSDHIRQHYQTNNLSLDPTKFAQEFQLRKEERDNGLYTAWQADLKPPRLKSLEEMEKLMDINRVLLYRWEADVQIWQRILESICSLVQEADKRERIRLNDLHGALELSIVEIISLKQQLKLLENTCFKQALNE